MEHIKKIIKSPIMILVLFAIKLIVYYILIGVNPENIIFILLSVAALGSILLTFSRSRLKRKKGIFLIIYSLLSLLMFSDSMYYNYYNQTVSIKQLWQASNVAAVPDSFVATLIPASFLLFLDIPFVYYYFKKLINYVQLRSSQILKNTMKYVLVSLFALFTVLVVNPFHSVAIDKVNSVEFFSNHVNDIYSALTEDIATEEVPAAEVLNNVEEVASKPEGAKLHGIGEGKNLIVVQVEALQNFVIGAEYNGQIITPNLNALINKDSLYFDNYYSNIGKGNTVDAEFSSLNSLYPVIDRECYTLYVNNTFNGLPWLLRDKGYNTFATHGYEGTFWNREAAYPGQGFQDFYSMEDLDASETIGLGISDKSMFRQAVDIMKQKKEPFFNFIVTLTSHHPFIIDPKDASLVLKEEDKETKFGGYLQTIHYMDEAVGEFITELKTAGLYDNTVIAFYGDHHGLNVNMDDNKEIMTNYLGREYDYDEMLNVPLIIHVPNSGVTKKISTTGGQIDFLPTIANIMGLDIDQPYILGQDLVNATDGFVAFTSYLFGGSFIHNDVMFEISREGVFDGSRAWVVGNHRSVDAAQYDADYNRAITLKSTSKEILDQDLIADYIKRDTTSQNTTDQNTTDSSSDQNTIDQNTTDQNSKNQSTTEQNSKNQNTTDQNSVNQNTTEQDTTEQDTTN